MAMHTLNTVNVSRSNVLKKALLNEQIHAVLLPEKNNTAHAANLMNIFFIQSI